MEITGLLEKDFDEPTPDLNLETIKLIHRVGWIGFTRRPPHPKFDRNGDQVYMENIGSIEASELTGTFPFIAEELTRDSYFTLNSSYRGAPWLNKITGLPDVLRKEHKHLAHLNLCYADLDVGRTDSDRPEQQSTCGDAIGAAVDLMDRGGLPQASIIARSGRGVYLFWLLEDKDDPGMPPRSYLRIDEYKKINKAIISRLTHLAADPNAFDAARVLRVDGSIHTGANKQVRYLIQTDDKGQVPFYTLEELASFFEIPTLENKLPAGILALGEGERKPRRRTKKPGSAPHMIKGYKVLNAKRAEDVVRLEQHREGFLKRGGIYSDGSVSPGRRLTLQLFAKFLRWSGAPQHETLEAVQTMAENCTPQYPSDPDDVSPAAIVRKVFGRTQKNEAIPNNYLCKIWGVSDDLARELDLKTIISKTVRLERKEQKPSKSTIMANRRRWIREHVDQNGLPKGGCRGMARLLNANSFNVCFKTVNSDLNALYPQGPRTRAPLA